MTETQGWTASGWEGVRDAFQANFDNGSEVGAAFSCYHRGEKVADLWGGIADQDRGDPWNEDTIIPVFSTTKGMTAIIANMLAQEGRLDVEAPVAEYWPEFAANGKQDIPVAYLLSHQAGLAWVDGEMTADEALAWDPVVERLAAEAPKWDPGTKHGYHATTYGWLVGEVIKRVTGKSVGTDLAEMVAGPLGLDCWIGLPESEEHRVATLISTVPPRNPDSLAARRPDPVADMIAMFMGPDTALGKALFAPGGAFTDDDIWNTRAMHAAEVPAANGICDARSLARLYAATCQRRRRHPAAHARAGQGGHRTPHPGAELHPDGHGGRVRPRVHAQPRRSSPWAGRARSATSARAARSAGPTPTPSWASATS